MHLPPRQLVVSLSAALTLGWSLVCLALLFAAGMTALRLVPDAARQAAGPLLTATAVVLIAAGAGVFSVSGIWVFGGPLLHAYEVWQADWLARRPQGRSALTGFTTERRIRLAHGATLLLLPAAVALLFVAPR